MWTGSVILCEMVVKQSCSLEIACEFVLHINIYSTHAWNGYSFIHPFGVEWGNCVISILPKATLEGARPPVGFEPATLGLQVKCTTTEPWYQTNRSLWSILSALEVIDITNLDKLHLCKTTSLNLTNIWKSLKWLPYRTSARKGLHVPCLCTTIYRKSFLNSENIHQLTLICTHLNVR